MLRWCLLGSFRCCCYCYCYCYSCSFDRNTTTYIFSPYMPAKWQERIYLLFRLRGSATLPPPANADGCCTNHFLTHTECIDCRTSSEALFELHVNPRRTPPKHRIISTVYSHAFSVTEWWGSGADKKKRIPFPLYTRTYIASVVSFIAVPSSACLSLLLQPPSLNNMLHLLTAVAYEWLLDVVSVSSKGCMKRLHCTATQLLLYQNTPPLPISD